MDSEAPKSCAPPTATELRKPAFRYIPDDQVIDVEVINNGIVVHTVTAGEQIALRTSANVSFYDKNAEGRMKVLPRPNAPAQYQYKHVYCNAGHPGYHPTTAPTQMRDNTNKLVYNRHHAENWQCWGCAFAPANWADLNKHFNTSETCPLRGTGNYSRDDIVANSQRVAKPGRWSE